MNYERCKIGQLSRCNSGGCEWKKVFGGYCNHRPTESEIKFLEDKALKEVVTNRPEKIKKYEEAVMTKQEQDKNAIAFKKKKLPNKKHKNIQLSVPKEEPFIKSKIKKGHSGRDYKIFKKSNGICHLCRNRLYADNFMIDSKSRPVHEICNSIKGNRLIPDELDNPLKIQDQEDWIKKIRIL